MPCTRLAASIAVNTVKLKIWKNARRSALDQPFSDAHTVGSTPDSAASPPRMPPQKPTTASTPRPPRSTRIRPAASSMKEQ